MKVTKVTALFISLFFVNTLAFAQDKNGPETKRKPIGVHVEALPYYNFGKGVGITSPDSLFQFNIRFRMQNRLQMDQTEAGETEYQAKIRRLRLRFDGYVGDPKFMYVIQLSFAPDDVGTIEEGKNLNVIRDAVVFYKIDEHWTLGFGQTKIPGNRQRLNSSGALQLTDRSINNSAYNIDRDFGFQASYNHQKEDAFGYNLKGAITTGEGRNFTGKTTGLAYTGRAEIYPLGEFKGRGEFFEGDLKREEKPKLYFGGTYHLNEKATQSQGQRGDELYETRNLRSVLFDAVMKYNGWAVMGSYMERHAKNPITINPLDNTEFNHVVAGHGFDFQTSYTFPSFWEVIGRYSTNTPQKEVATYINQQNQWSLGLTKYIWEHAFKAQLEFTKTYNKTFNGTKDDDWYVRFQVEIGI